MKFVKLLLINISVLFALFSSLIFAIVIFSEVARIYKDNYGYKSTNCIRSSCQEVYNNYPWAKKHFLEYSRLKFHYESPVVWRADQFNGETINILPDYQRKTINKHQESKSKAYFFGGSVVWGFGSNDENTIPSHFSSISSITSSNYGESAWTSDQSLLYLMKLIKAGHKPDYVIFINGVNDIAKCYSDKPNFYGFLQEDNLKIKLKESIKSYSRISFENYFSIPIEFLNRFFRKKIPEEQKNKENMTGCKKYNGYNLIAKNMVENWKIANSIVKKFNGKFIAILEPNIYYTNTKIHPSIKIINYDRDETKKIYLLVSELVSKLSYVYDYKDIYNGIEKYVFTDIGSHVSPDANRFMANKIFSIIKEKKNELDEKIIK